MEKEEIEKFIEELKNHCGDYMSFEDMTRRSVELQLLLALQEYYNYNF